jgi:hypothetical protein
LWDGVHSQGAPIDKWGHCAAYNTTSDKNLHIASQAQYHADKNIVAAQVWDDFAHVHWPTIYEQKKADSNKKPKNEEDDDFSWVGGEYGDGAVHVQKALLA